MENGIYKYICTPNIYASFNMKQKIFTINYTKDTFFAQTTHKSN